MSSVWKRLVVVFGLVLVLVPGIVTAQSNVATGEIVGTVTDQEGGVLPGTVVVAKNVDTGFSRSGYANKAGFYRLGQLPSGIYDVRAVMEGFKTEIKKGIEVNLGSSLKVGFQMSLSAVEEEIVVTALAPVVETTNPSIAASVSDTAIANLPLNGRDFFDFVSLTPASVAEPEIGRTHIGGMRGIQNSFNIDGANNQSTFFGEERGGTRSPFTFSQAAIKEFQVIRSSYNVQFGNASGGIINAITKSGTNDFKGELWYYMRDDSMVADDARGYETDDFEQEQFGFAVGGPLIRDRLHYFVSYDGQRLERPTYRRFYGIFDQDIAEWESITGLNYDNETGQIQQTNDQDAILLKLDWQASTDHLVTFRDNYSSYSGENATSSYTTTGRSNNGYEENSFNSVVATLNSVFSDNAFNELTVQYALEERPRDANNTSLPEAQIGRSYDAVFGQNNFLPNWLNEERVQIRDKFTYYLGNHTLKAGFDLDTVELDDGFFRYGGGHFLYDEWDLFFRNEPTEYVQAFSDYNGQVIFDTTYYAAYLQDEWRVNPNVTLTYGLRYDLQAHDQPQETNPAYPDTGSIPDDTDNFAPRVGFAWDVNGDGKQVLRGGVGYFYDRSPSLLDANAMLANGIRVVRVTVDCAGADCPQYPETFGSPGDLPTVTPDIFVFDHAFENPETVRMSIGYEREVAPNFSIGVDLTYSQTDHLERKKDLNLAIDDDELTRDGRYIYDRYANYDELGKIIQFTSDAAANYRSLVVKAHKRFSNGWMVDASYTYARARDNDSNERSVSSSGGFPEDQYDLEADWGPSDYDVKHKVVASATAILPYDFHLSGIVYIRSGFPFSAYGAEDLNTDGYYNDRATVLIEPGVYYHYPRNSFRHPWYRRVDLRLSKSFRVFGDAEIELIGEVFNLFDHANWRTGRYELVGSDGEINDDFGERTSPGDPRQFQIGAKIRF